MKNLTDLICYGLGNEFKNAKFQPIANQFEHPKPFGGLWASPIKSKNNWKNYCEQNNFNLSKLKTFFTFDYYGKILIIDCFNDLHKLTWRTIFRNIQYVDFEKTSLKYDAIYVTSKGVHETAFALENNLYGWDCESVFIMNSNGIKPHNSTR